MSDHRSTVTGPRTLTMEERINIAEGEDDLVDSNDDADMPNGGQISFDEYLSAFVDEDTVDLPCGDEGRQDGKKRRKLGHGGEKGERVAWDDDEDSDSAYNHFKKRKSEKRKQVLASIRRAKLKASSSSVVGLRRKVVTRDQNKEPVWGETENEEEALMETTLPDYLKQRQFMWAKRRDELGHAGLLTPPHDDDIPLSDDERIKNLQEKPNLPHLKPSMERKDIQLPYSLGIIPAPIAQWLRAYQVKGVEFLHKLFVYQEGGILGDDMGLGKTIMVIAFLTAAFGKAGDERDDKRMRKMRRMDDGRFYPRVLIICPGGLMANWNAELERWGWWQVYTYHGTSAMKETSLAAAHKGRLEIMITTYTTYRLNESALNGIHWDCVIADECHIIKGKDAEITQAMNRVNALCRIGLSGTAIQNKYEELWTLLNWTSPGRLGPLSVWKQSICVPLKLGQSHDATVTQLAKSRKTATKLVQNLLPRFFLRRTKTLIADQLPKKSDKVVFCPLTEVQADAYNNFCDSEIVQCIRTAAEPCSCGSGKKQGWCCHAKVRGYGKWQNFVFPCLVTLQKLANHVALLIPPGEANKEQHDKDLEKMEIALPSLWRELYSQRDSILNFAKTEFCGKWRVLKKLLKLWYENGDKVLIFSHSVRLLRMLNMLFKATTSYNISYLDGSMSYEDRQTTVDDYNADSNQFVFLISTKAGGVGLNITSANKVVVVDPNWNPSYDLQAQDRAYRIGQTRDVEVFRLVSVGTVEEIVYARQIYKQQQANIGYDASVERRYFKGVQDQKDQKGEIFGLGNLFAPQADNVVLRDIVNKTNVAETRSGIHITGLDLEASQEEDEGSSALLNGVEEDAAMSQLAAAIIDEPAARRKAAQDSAKRKDPVMAILASVGVEYTHDNAQVIGTSRIETKISSRAQKAGNDLDFVNEMAFAEGDGELGPSISDPSLNTVGFEGDAKDVDEKKILYRYRPPEPVRRRQFCTMARHFGYQDVTEFALVVEGWTQEQRRNCLDKFYKIRKVKMGGAKASSTS